MRGQHRNLANDPDKTLFFAYSSSLAFSVENFVSVSLSTNLDDPLAIPYFLWDEPMTVEELRHRLQTASLAEQTRLLGKVLREARDTDVWKFTSPEEVWRQWPALSRHLGRRRSFWEFLFAHWCREGLIDGR